MSPILSKLCHDGHIRAAALEQSRVFEAAVQFARCEGLLPAPESSHAICAALDEARRCKETGEPKTILFGLSGTGYFDMAAYMQHNDGSMADFIPTGEDLAKGFATLPGIPQNA
jgi:tryptophan synthase beta chain